MTTNVTDVPGQNSVVAANLNPALWTALRADGRTVGFHFYEEP